MVFGKDMSILDWFSRYIVSWQVSITMDVALCMEAPIHALGTGKPEILNTDRGSQFTSRSFTGVLEGEGPSNLRSKVLKKRQSTHRKIVSLIRVSESFQWSFWAFRPLLQILWAP